MAAGDKLTESTTKKKQARSSVDSYVKQIVERCKKDITAFVNRSNYLIPKTIGELSRRVGSNLRSFKTSYCAVGIIMMHTTFFVYSASL